MPAIRTQIAQALQAAAAAIAPEIIADPVTVYRNRRRPPDANAVRVWINILTSGFDADDTVSSDGTFYTDDVTVEGAVSANTDEQAADELDDLYAATVKALMADTQLGGLAIDVRQVAMVTEFTDIEGSPPVGTFSLTLQVDYRTLSGDPYTPVP